MNATSFIARRLFFRNSNASRSTAVHIATAGVGIGVFIMLLSVSIAIGFQHEIKEKVRGFCGDIQVKNYNSFFSPVSHPISFSEGRLDSLRTIPHVARVQKFASKTGMFKTDETFLGVQFRGIDNDYDTPFLPKDSIRFATPNWTVVSAFMARRLNLEVGSKVFAYFFDETLRARRFTVVGIYETHMSEFDESVCYVDVNTVQKLTSWNEDQYSGVEIFVDEQENIPTVARNARIMVNRDFDKYGEGYAAMTVSDLYPQIFSWLALLDTNVWAILVLMLCVCAVTAVCGLLVIILENTSLIGSLKAFGASDSQVRSTFLNLSALILTRALLWGNALAILFIFVQKYTGIISLDPQTYYVSQVPVSFSWGYFLLVDSVTFIITLLVLIVPSMVISRISPVTSMRFE